MAHRYRSPYRAQGQACDSPRAGGLFLRRSGVPAPKTDRRTIRARRPAGSRVGGYFEATRIESALRSGSDCALSALLSEPPSSI